MFFFRGAAFAGIVAMAALRSAAASTTGRGAFMGALPIRCFQNALTAALVPRPGQVGAVPKAGEAAGRLGNFFLETALFNIVLQEGTLRGGFLTGGRSWT